MRRVITLRQVEQVLGALVEGQVAPPAGGLAGAGDGGVDLGPARDRVRADDVAGGRVERVEGPSVGRVARVAVRCGSEDELSVVIATP